MIYKIFEKVRKQGIRWFYWRLKQEFFNPTVPYLKVTVDYLLKFKNFLNNSKKSSDHLYAIFDLEVSPITYNIGEYLCAAELEAKRLKKNGIVLIIVPEKNKKRKYLNEYEKIISEEGFKWRVDNIIVQVARLHAACKGISILPDRLTIKHLVDKHDIFPKLYDGTNLRYADLSKLYAAKPNSFEGLRAAEQGKKYVKQYLQSISVNTKIVTIIIRDYSYDKVRNSNQEEISKFIEYLISRKFQPIVIPDTDSAFDTKLNIDSKYIFRDGCWNVGLRIALYELSFVNIFGPGGAACIMLFNPLCSCILINPIVENSITSSAEAYAKAGIYEGTQWSFLQRKQIISYKKETFENLVSEFENFLRLN